MAEWSKAVDLSLNDTYSTGEIRVGSNPTGTIIFGRVESIFFSCGFGSRKRPTGDLLRVIMVK